MVVGREDSLFLCHRTARGQGTMTLCVSAVSFPPRAAREDWGGAKPQRRRDAEAGSCMAGMPLLFTGEDFAKTDLPAA